MLIGNPWRNPGSFDSALYGQGYRKHISLHEQHECLQIGPEELKDVCHGAQIEMRWGLGE